MSDMQDYRRKWFEPDYEETSTTLTKYKICPECHKIVGVGDNYCSSCAMPLADAAVVEMSPMWIGDTPDAEL